MARWGLERGWRGKNKVSVSKVNVGIERSTWLVGTGERTGMEKDVQGSRGGIKRVYCVQHRVMI